MDISALKKKEKSFEQVFSLVASFNKLMVPPRIRLLNDPLEVRYYMVQQDFLPFALGPKCQDLTPGRVVLASLFYKYHLKKTTKKPNYPPSSFPFRKSEGRDITVCRLSLTKCHKHMYFHSKLQA